jgi:hypothetical protein
MDGAQPPLPPGEHEKEDITFLTSREEHLGHLVSPSGEFTLWRRENFSLHDLQIYS